MIFAFLKKIFFYLLNYTDKINSKIFEYKVSKLPYNNGLSLLDLGSSYDIEPRWKKIKKYLRFYGCEPNNNLIKNFKDKNKDCISCEIFPFIIGRANQKKTTLNICKNPGVSSLLKPNFEYLKLYPESDRFGIKKKKKFQSCHIDNLKIKKIDFLKLDIQGAELDALKGGNKTIKQSLGLEIEVEFQEIYFGQPLYGDINKYLISKKFYFNDFTYISRHERKDFSGYGQSVFANALYLRNPEFVNKNIKDKYKIINYILILLLYNKFDFIDCLKLNKHFSAKEMYQIKKTVKFFKRKNKIARFISSMATGMTRLLGNEYKSHLFN